MGIYEFSHMPGIFVLCYNNDNYFDMAKPYFLYPQVGSSIWTDVKLKFRKNYGSFSDKLQNIDTIASLIGESSFDIETKREMTTANLIPLFNTLYVLIKSKKTLSKEEEKGLNSVWRGLGFSRPPYVDDIPVIVSNPLTGEKSAFTFSYVAGPSRVLKEPLQKRYRSKSKKFGELFSNMFEDDWYVELSTLLGERLNKFFNGNWDLALDVLGAKGFKRHEYGFIQRNFEEITLDVILRHFNS